MQGITINDASCIPRSGGDVDGQSTTQLTEDRPSSFNKDVSQINALEKGAKDVLHELNSLWNPLQLVHRLPPEVIALCATFASHADPRPIVSLTHVCRYWREAIISNPGNWTSISSGWKRLIPLCLERAGAVPLTVKITASDIKGHQNFHEALPTHVSRISHLSLTGYSSIEDLADDLPGFFALTLPNLTSLELERAKRPTRSSPSNETPMLPLFQGVSKLKSLHLTRVPLYPALYNITSLVELKLAVGTIPFRGLIGLLESNVALEILVLDLGFTESSVWTVPETEISLPRLRHLEFTCRNTTNARGLFSSVSFPRGVHITVQGSQSNPPYAELAAFLPSPPTRIQALLTPITTIKHWDSPRQLHLSSPGGTFHFHRPVHVTPTICEEFKLFATGVVREFHLNLNDEYPVSRLIWLLKRLPALEALIISGNTPRSGALFPLAEKPVICPSLKTIAFFNCKGLGDLIPELGKVLEKRARSIAARLHRVVVVAGDGFDLPHIHWIRELQKLAPRVDIGFGDKLPDLL